MKLLILTIFAICTSGFTSETKTTFFPGKEIENFNYVSGGVAPFLEIYKITNDWSWIFLPELSIGHRHFITKRNSIDSSVTLRGNRNIQEIYLSSSYIFYPFPEYGFYLGGGINHHFIYFTCVESDNYHQWGNFHGTIGLQFKISEEKTAFVQVRYFGDNTFSVLYGHPF